MRRVRREKSERDSPFVGLLVWVMGLGLSLFTSCSSDYSPKPYGYPAIPLPESAYAVCDSFASFRFDLSTSAHCLPVEQDSAEGEWYNIVYPSLNAQIYCSYLQVPKERWEETEADMKNFVTLHSQRAEQIGEQAYEDREHQLYGSLYRLEGRVPSPIQFVLTDRVNTFFRGALYFEGLVDPDSIAPVLDYLNHDIEILIESFRWKR